MAHEHPYGIENMPPGHPYATENMPVYNVTQLPLRYQDLSLLQTLLFLEASAECHYQ